MSSNFSFLGVNYKIIYKHDALWLRKQHAKGHNNVSPMNGNENTAVYSLNFGKQTMK